MRRFPAPLHRHAPSSVHPRSPQLRALAERFAGATAAERANYALYLTELADALGVTRPAPAGGGFQFEYPVKLASRRTGGETTNFADLYREGHFLLEAKDSGAPGSNELLLRKAYAQAADYAGHVPPHPPPFVMVLDVGRVMLVWDRWSGTYGGFPLARRIDLQRLADNPDDIEFLRAAWENPASLDPNARGRQVTREVAERLARLSASLDERVDDPERVARFVMRCVFTMFAEDVGLLQEEPFTKILRRFAGPSPVSTNRSSELPPPPIVPLGAHQFSVVVEGLWRAMDHGEIFGPWPLLRFNGHFFKDAEALPLSREDVAILAEAAEANWQHVEPSIFGTLLTRALDPVERHRLGAEYTPREYVERVVRQAVDVPIRERWAPVQAEVLQLRERGRNKDRDAALARLREFHAWMRGLSFLDPACGSGNFLYVTLHTVKRIELEVLREIEALTGNPELGLDEVGPWQFHGIEIKAWAREIAELTLWIGFHQFWMEHHKGVNPPEPVLQDTGTLEQRDAVLAWDGIVEDPSKSRPDPTPRIPHPVTGKLVPDPNARLPYYVHVNARQAEWPKADFIVGNPPYMGQFRMRESFGDGYVDALRRVYPDVPDTADYVMYWWYRVAVAVTAFHTTRAGLITTNTITQKQNRRVVTNLRDSETRIVWAIADHPWVEETGGADVRVAITVLARDVGFATLLEVDEHGNVISEQSVRKLNDDLSVHSDVPRASAVSLKANDGICSPGFKLDGAGFILSEQEARRLLTLDEHHREILRPYLNGRDLSARPRGVWLIDFGMRSEEEARTVPVLYDIVRDRVKPERDAKPDALRRDRWWRLGRPREQLRDAIAGTARFVVTIETAKHRLFTFLGTNVAPDNKLICIALPQAFYLGVLSSRIHVVWALAAGGKLGVGNDPVYVKSSCFDPFPFPDPPKALRERIGLVAETLDQHRKDAIARDERVTMTGMYNVVEKLRSGEALTPKEREIHQLAACGVLLDLHNELDALVAQAYGWPWPMEREEILERLVALHDERLEEEKRGIVRWLRPEYQIPRFGKGAVQQEAAELLPAEAAAEPATPAERRPWPGAAGEQITAVEQVVKQTPATADTVAAAFDRARPELVRHHLQYLVLVGQLREADGGRFEPVAEPL